MSFEGLPALHRRLTAIASPAGDKRMLQMLALATVREAKVLVPRKTGYLGRSIVIASNSGTEAKVAARAKYAAYVEHGTGIYGASHRPIVPVRAKVLAWRTGAGGAGGAQLRLSSRSRTRRGVQLGGWAFARSVRGRKATPFLIPGAKKAVGSAHLEQVIITEWNSAA